ncbi:hypothetical protein PO909_015568 [Leuciscus waleckii]
MEWRIIVAVLCLIGILHVPGNAAQMNNSAIYYRFTLHFSMNGTFLDVYSNSTDNETVDLRKNITSKVEQLYKPKYTNFERFEILHIRKGSIVTEGELQFSNGSKPNVADLTQILNNGSFTFTIIQNATSIAEVTPQNQSTTGQSTPATTPVTNQTASPVTNQTATPVTNQTATPVTTVSAPAKVAQINLVFSIAKDFKDTYSNLSDPETKDLSNSITTACSKVYKSRFPKFHRMFIRKFSKGSIVIDSVLEFDSTNGTSPNVTDVKDTLVTAITNGSFNFTINNSSINTTDIPETSANRSPVLASMLTALWMTLASLLLSAVMH